jgi:hypothetical protein
MERRSGPRQSTAGTFRSSGSFHDTGDFIARRSTDPSGPPERSLQEKNEPKPSVVSH